MDSSDTILISAAKAGPFERVQAVSLSRTAGPSLESHHINSPPYWDRGSCPSPSHMPAGTGRPVKLEPVFHDVGADYRPHCAPPWRLSKALSQQACIPHRMMTRPLNRRKWNFPVNCVNNYSGPSALTVSEIGAPMVRLYGRVFTIGIGSSNSMINAQTETPQERRTKNAEYILQSCGGL